MWKQVRLLRANTNPGGKPDRQKNRILSFQIPRPRGLGGQELPARAEMKTRKARHVMAKQTEDDLHPRVSLRMTPAEKARLQAEARGAPLQRHILDIILKRQPQGSLSHPPDEGQRQPQSSSIDIAQIKADFKFLFIYSQNTANQAEIEPTLEEARELKEIFARMKKL
jgi:hypothetical protein